MSWYIINEAVLVENSVNICLWQISVQGIDYTYCQIYAQSDNETNMILVIFTVKIHQSAYNKAFQIL